MQYENKQSMIYMETNWKRCTTCDDTIVPHSSLLSSSLLKSEKINPNIINN